MNTKPSDMTRRKAMTKVVAAGIAGGVAINQATAANDDSLPLEQANQEEEATQEQEEKSGNRPRKAPKGYSSDRDREAIMAAGLNEDEAECWKLVAAAAGKFFELEELHPLDNKEVAEAIHIVQNKLLSRPTYRTYIKEAKARMGKKDN